jgi:hypothetical protein
MDSKEKPRDEDPIKAIKSGKLPTNSVGLLQFIRELINKLSPALQVFLALLGLVVAIYFGYELRNRLLNNHKNIAGAFQSKLETTAHPQKGIAAFLLSGLEEVTPSYNEFSDQLSWPLTIIENKLKELSDGSKNLKTVAKTKPPKRSEAKRANSAVQTLPAGTNVESLKLEVKDTKPNSASAWQKIILSNASQSRFLMVPAISLRRKGLNDKPLSDKTPKEVKELEDVLKNNPEVLFDLYAASAIEPLFTELDYISIQSLPVVQTYFISESGVLMLRAPGVKDWSKYYQGQFAAYTLFMDRPYFWGAIDPKLAKKSKGIYYHITEPYIDLGGNGIVVTYSQRVELPNKRAAIIGVDLKLTLDSEDKIKSRLKELGADVNEFACITEPEQSGVIEGKLPKEFKWFENGIKDIENQSRYVGAIALGPEQSSPYGPKGGEHIISFTIPLDSQGFKDGKRRTTLLGASIDFDSISDKLDRDLILFSAGIVLLVIVSSNIFNEYTALKEDMNKVFEKLSKVMEEAYTPFAWLNEKNEFHKINESFSRVLEYDNIEDLKRHSPTFRGLMTAETQPIYNEVLAQSAAGAETGKYEVDMKTKSGKVLHVVVHGERIPYPTFWRRGRPHRFGVFLKWYEKPDNKQP